MTAIWQRRPEVAQARNRSVATLAGAQVLSALGVGVGPSVGVLLAAEVTHSEAWAGVARAAMTVGAAVVALPLASYAASRGRRAALSLAFGVAAAGACLVALSAQRGSAILFVLGVLGLGFGTAAGLQTRFAGADLAEPARRARTLSLVVWAGTVGAVFGPSLAEPGALLGARAGWHPYAGAFVLAALLLAATAAGVSLLLRPDPLRLAQRFETGRSGRLATTRGRAAYARAWRTVGQHPAARAALVAQVLAHLVMVVVMTMTPVHLDHGDHSLTIIGFTISLHVLGMWAFAPLFGWAADRLGPHAVIAIGAAIALAACLVCVASAASTSGVAVGLFLLGLGWSAVTVPAAALLTGAVDVAERPYVQGFGDFSMNAVAAIGAAISGPVMAGTNFSVLAAIAALAVLPIGWAARQR